jgi:feruloyl esterase
MQFAKSAVTLASSLALLSLPAMAGDCGALAKLALPATTITIAEPLPAGSFTPPSAQRPIDNLPQFCRIAGTIKPSSDSMIQFETWMPIEGWNGKFQGIGNGGFAGIDQLRRVGRCGAQRIRGGIH